MSDTTPTFETPETPIIFNLSAVLYQLHEAYLSDKPIHILSGSNQFSPHLRSPYLLVLKKLADLDERDMILTYKGTDLQVTFRDRPAPPSPSLSPRYNGR